MLAMGTGARRQEMGDVRADHVMLSTTGTRFGQSSITRAEAAAILGLPGIRKGSQGEPIVVLESLVIIEGHRRGTGARIFFPLLGINQTLAQYQPELRFTGGRMFQPGLHELIAGNPCTRQFTGFGIGDRRLIRGMDWTVVGHFDQGQGQQCVVYADVDSIMSAFTRNTYSSAAVMLQSAADFDAFRNAVQADPTLHLDVQHESEVVEDGFKQLNAILNFVSYFVGTIMAIGATLGAVNSLYAIVDSRRRELATLRAIGFGSAAVVVSILVESVLLALPGALLGGALAWVLFNGLSASSLRLQFSTRGNPVTGRDRHRVGAGHGFAGRPVTRAARRSGIGHHRAPCDLKLPQRSVRASMTR